MPGQKPGIFGNVLDWPYVEGLRMDEAMHPLAILSVGLYGEILPAQNGAPIRLVVPWKYGFKSIKSIVKVRFVEKQPPDRVEHDATARIRLLFQRQSRSRPSALESSHRAAHRRIFAPQDSDVQRLRRTSREPVQRHGLKKILLMKWKIE